MNNFFTQFTPLKIAVAMLLFFGMQTQMSAQDATCYADVVIANEVTACTSNQGFNDPTFALGAPDYVTASTPNTFYSLGDINSYVILGFTDNVLTNSGTNDFDLTIYEVGPAVEQTDIYLLPANAATEAYLVSMSMTPDADGFYFFTNVPGATTDVDIDQISPGIPAGDLVFNQVKIVSPVSTPCNAVSGPDIDAVCALSTINCFDNDGDGITDCDGDCNDDDANVGIPPAAPIDLDCNGTAVFNDATCEWDVIPDANYDCNIALVVCAGALPQPFPSFENDADGNGLGDNCSFNVCDGSDFATRVQSNLPYASTADVTITFPEGLLSGGVPYSAGIVDAIFNIPPMGSATNGVFQPTLTNPTSETLCIEYTLIPNDPQCSDCQGTPITYQVCFPPVAVEPTTENCWDDFQYDDATCAYINQGEQATQPEMVNCYDEFVFDTDACTWMNIGVQPEITNFISTGTTCNAAGSGVQYYGTPGTEVTVSIPGVGNYDGVIPANGTIGFGFIPAPGNYTATITAISLNGCEGIAGQTVDFESVPSPTDVTVTSTSPVCTGDDGSFTISSPTPANGGDIEVTYEDCGAGSQDASCEFGEIIGNYSAVVNENGVLYTTTANISCSGSTVAYSLGCSGTWTYNGFNGTSYLFSENITAGSGCVLTGDVAITPQGNDILYEYFYTGGTNVVVGGVLNNSPVCTEQTTILNSANGYSVDFPLTNISQTSSINLTSATNNGICQAELTGSASIEVLPIPVITEFISTETTCNAEGSGVQYYGTPGTEVNVNIPGVGNYDGVIPANGTIGFGFFPAPGDYTATITAISLNGCEGVAGQTVDFTSLPNPEITDFISTETTCNSEGSGVQYYGTPGTEVNVNIPGVGNYDGVIPANGTIGFGFFPAPGDYIATITAISLNGCEGVAGQTVDFTSLPNPELTDFTITPSTCDGEEVLVSYTGTPGATVGIDIPNVGDYTSVLDTDGIYQFSFVSSTGDYTATITSVSLNGCDGDLSGMSPIDFEVTNCYCESNGESTDYEWIESISLNGTTNQSGADGGYGDYTNIVLPISTGNNSVNLTPGFSGNSYYEYWTVYIDYDQSGSFEYSEMVYYNASSNTINGNFNVPLTALTGETRMRISMRYGDWPWPCDVFAEGEVEDYTVNITFCDNVTDGGNIGEDEVLCDGNTDPAMMTSNTDASGGSGGDIEYLWLMNTTTSNPPTANSMNGWVEIANSNSPSYDPAPISETTWYLRCARRNGCGTYPGESNIIEKKVQSSCVEYCESGGEDTWYEWIEGIWLADIDNTSGNNGGYADFTGISTDLQQGSYYTFTGSPGYNNCYEREYWRVWIDWNQDGDFSDSGERLFSRKRYGSFSKTIFVPTNAMLGETRMRVSMKYGGWPQACQEFGYGETEDYTINVTDNGGSRQAPVTVFHAEKDELQSELWWVNNHGSQIESFELERSADGTNFETIKSETEVVESNDMTRYLHMDAQPMKGDNHYRVLVKYDNGDAKYTEVRILNFADIGNYGVYPNPADEYVMLNLADFVDGAADIKIIDAYGKTRYQERVDLITTEAVRIDLNNFIDGVYFINVVVEGKRMVSKKLMINKLYGWR